MGDISRRDAIITTRDTPPQNERIKRYCTSDAYKASDGSDDRRKRLACGDERLKGSLSVITYFYP
jgi:hypothetical protein